MNSGHCVGERVLHQRDDARVPLASAEDTIRVKAQHTLDRGRQFAHVDTAGFGEITLADGASERLRRVPDVAEEVALFVLALLLLLRRRGVPGVERVQSFGTGHVFDPHEPIDPVTMRAAGVAVIVIGIDAA